jgi:hypothetical protein
MAFADRMPLGQLVKDQISDLAVRLQRILYLSKEFIDESYR